MNLMRNILNIMIVTVHHFTSQNVQTLEQPTASTIAPPDRFLTALMSNCIEVRDLKNNAELLFSFPTVDEVTQLCYSSNGDYVVTLETKFNRQNREINFVRVYLNWNSIATLQQSKMTNSGVSLGSSECGMVQPMRARIAGRVTPTSNQSDTESLEMIEIPVKNNPHLITCCPITGNLLILSGKEINIYKFKVKIHDISKQKFVDFEDCGLKIELKFEPTKIEMYENYIAAMNKERMYMFRIYKRTSKENSTYVTKNVRFRDTHLEYEKTESIDYEKLLTDEQNMLRSKITINLPSIVRENSLIHKHNPFTYSDREMAATISNHNIETESKICPYKIKNLIHLRLVPILIENAEKHITEEFKTFYMKPIYVEKTAHRKNRKETIVENKFTSEFSILLNGVSCMIATQQEGFLYYFDDTDFELSKETCIAVYPFTAPVFQIVMEDCFVHALTETGLESYTLRTGHKVTHNFGTIDNLYMACPPVDDPICLVGLRPFLGVEKILLANNHLLLLANADTSPTHSVTSNSSSIAVYWTLYSLELPDPLTIFKDILMVANAHRFTSAQTYCHLLHEGHVVLRMGLIMHLWTTTDDAIKLVTTKRNENRDVIYDAFKNSAALMADHYVMCQNEDKYSLAIPYYKAGNIPALEVIKRVRQVQIKSNSQFMKGLVHFLNHIILDTKVHQQSLKLFEPTSKQVFLEEFFGILEEHSFDDLPHLILKSKLLKEYSTDKLIEILNKKNNVDDSSLKPEHNLVLCVLHVQKNCSEEAVFYLEKIKSEDLYRMLSENYWEILFEYDEDSVIPKGFTNFSDIADLIISHFPDNLADIFVHLTLKTKTMTLNRLLKVFMEFIPSSTPEKSTATTAVLQKTLEDYFNEYFSKVTNLDVSTIFHDKGAKEGLKLLMRSYLSQLSILQFKEDKESEYSENSKFSSGAFSYESDEIENEEKLEEIDSIKTTFLFDYYRYEYLKKMPPFRSNKFAKMYRECVEDYEYEIFSSNEQADLILAKIQGILCSPVVSKSLIEVVETYISLNDDLRGKTSIQTIFFQNERAIDALIEKYPHVLMEFAKNRLKTPEEWKYLIGAVQQQILKIFHQDNLKKVCFFYQKLLKDILHHVAITMSLSDLELTFPVKLDKRVLVLYPEILIEEIQDYDTYYAICKETKQADKIRELIIKTGQQLLCTLNL